MTRNPSTRFGGWLHERATPERIEDTEEEPYWLPEDRDIVTVWQIEQRQRCHECGTFDWEWEEERTPWYPDHYTCLGCKGLSQHRKATEHNVTDGTKYALYKEERG